jgi:hypothetical protein
VKFEEEERSRGSKKELVEHDTVHDGPRFGQVEVFLTVHEPKKTTQLRSIRKSEPRR